ncbi:MAG: hypothetical protein R2824_08470 [Saprospiraceae bacterium]
MAQNKLSDFSHRGKNGYLDKIYDRLDELPILVTEKELLELINYDSHRSLNKEFKFKIKQIPFSRALIRKLYLALHINPEDFLLDQTDESEFFKQFKNYSAKDFERLKSTYFTHEHWRTIKSFRPFSNPDPFIDFFSFPHDQKTNQYFLDTYTSIAQNFRQAEKSIKVYEILFKGNNDDPGNMSVYAEGQKIIFQAILETLKRHKEANNKEFRYIRTFSLSWSQYTFPKNSKEDLPVAFAAEASRESFEHIIECITNYSDYCEFYVTPISMFRHHALIDQKKLLTEDYLMLADGSIIPDWLFIFDTSNDQSKASLFREAVLKSFRIPASKKYDLKKKNLISIIDAAIKFINDQLNEKPNIDKLIEMDLGGQSQTLKRLLNKEEDFFEALERQLQSLSAKKALVDTKLAK